MPPDPFANDPSDSSIPIESSPLQDPLDAEERIAIEEDLADLVVYQALLKHRGIRGLIVHCEETEEDHYHDWDILKANLRQLLLEGSMYPHEPACDPNPNEYVTWDYCKGYVDAIMHMSEDDLDT